MLANTLAKIYFEVRAEVKNKKEVKGLKGEIVREKLGKTEKEPLRKSKVGHKARRQ